MSRSYRFGNDESLFSIADLHVGLWPFLQAIGLGAIVILPGVYANEWALRLFGMDQIMSKPWIALFASHFTQLCIALAAIAWVGRMRFRDYGFRRPEGKSYVGAAVAYGVLFGLIMTVVDYLPQILAQTAPQDMPLTKVSLAGWLSFEGLFVGISEEVPFRGLLQTFLMKRTTGRVRFWKYEMHVAGILLAFLFALAHLSSFWQEPFWSALGQQGYAFALGILYAYWFEKSGSLLASIVGHNVGDFVEYCLLFLMAARWR
jgi:uncharacterized protein